MVPKWDSERRELRVDQRIIKRYRWPAANQERILDAFEEEGWPHRIDDPIPPDRSTEPRQRLRDTINSLNNSLEPMLIRFRGDGTGRGIIWQSQILSRHTGFLTSLNS